MGLGSTAQACATLGVPCVGFEIDPEYARLARERLAETAVEIEEGG
jgi:DNA modification methylase